MRKGPPRNYVAPRTCRCAWDRRYAPVELVHKFRNALHAFFRLFYTSPPPLLLVWARMLQCTLATVLNQKALRNVRSGGNGAEGAKNLDFRVTKFLDATQSRMFVYGQARSGRASGRTYLEEEVREWDWGDRN